MLIFYTIPYFIKNVLLVLFLGLTEVRTQIDGCIDAHLKKIARENTLKYEDVIDRYLLLKYELFGQIFNKSIECHYRN